MTGYHESLKISMHQHNIRADTLSRTSSVLWWKRLYQVTLYRAPKRLWGSKYGAKHTKSDKDWLVYGITINDISRVSTAMDSSCSRSCVRHRHIKFDSGRQLGLTPLTQRVYFTWSEATRPHLRVKLTGENTKLIFVCTEFPDIDYCVHQIAVYVFIDVCIQKELGTFRKMYFCVSHHAAGSPSYIKVLRRLLFLSSGRRSCQYVHMKSSP